MAYWKGKSETTPLKSAAAVIAKKVLKFGGETLVGGLDKLEEERIRQSEGSKDDIETRKNNPNVGT